MPRRGKRACDGKRILQTCSSTLQKGAEVMPIERGYPPLGCAAPISTADLAAETGSTTPPLCA